jgi:iron(III) transport system permease protein
VVLLYLVLIPFGLLVFSTFKDGSVGLPIEPATPFTLANYREVFFNGATYRVIGNTLLYSVGALAIAFVCAGLLAWLVERTNLPFRNVAFVLILAPAGIPGFIFAIGWAILLNPSNGILNLLLRGVFAGDGPGPVNIYSLPGMMIVMGLTLVPLTFLLLSASFRGMNAAYDDAASVSGASLRKTLPRITFPIAIPAILTALVYQFVSVVESLDVPLVLGLPGRNLVLSTYTYLVARPPTGLPDYGRASTYGVLLFLLAITPLLLYLRVMRRGASYSSVGGRGYRARTIELGKLRIPAIIFVIAYLVVALALPLLTLIWTSVQPFIGGVSMESFSQLTLEGYSRTLALPAVASSVRNTLVIAITAALGAMTLAFFVAWVTVRSRSRMASALDALAFTPHAMPGVMIGISLLLLYLFLPVPIYGTIWIIAIALGTQYISLATRVTSSGLVRLHGSMEEAALVNGGSPLQSIRRITLPLMRPSILYGFLLVFIHGTQNLTLPLLLSGSGTGTVSVLIFSRWVRGDPIGAAVLGVLVATITMVASALIRKATANDGNPS